MFVAVFLLLFAVIRAFLLDSISNKKVQVLLTTGDQSKRLSHELDLHPTSANSGTIRIDRSKKIPEDGGIWCRHFKLGRLCHIP